MPAYSSYRMQRPGSPASTSSSMEVSRLSADADPRDDQKTGLDGEYREAELPLLIQRRGMAYWCGDHVRILDRRQLPHREVELICRTVEDVAVAIETMAIQGAFTLAIAAGYGMALVAGDPATARAK